jgi:hypothetical protein
VRRVDTLRIVYSGESVILRIVYGGESMNLRIVYSGELGDAKNRFLILKNTLVLLSVDADSVSSRTKKYKNPPP